MPKKHSLAALLALFTGLLIFCCVESTRLFASADRQFETLADDIFRQEVSANTITLHYTLQNPSDYGVSHPDISLGTYPVSSLEVSAAAENCLSLLHSIPYQELNDANQLTYLVLQDSLDQTLTGTPYLLYDEPLSPLTGIQSQLPVLLSEYQFYQMEDVDTYLELLQTLPDHFESLIHFEQAKSDAGLFMASYTADAIIEECRAFLDMGTGHYLYSTFEDRLDALEDCGSSAKETYIARNAQILADSVFPAYQNLIDSISDLRETGTNQNGLCHLPDGSAYYSYLVREETGSERTVEELESLTRTQMQEDLLVMQSILSSQDLPSPAETPAGASSDSGSSASSETSGILLPDFALEDSNPSAILIDLKGKLNDNFPAIPEVDIQVKYVQPEMAEFLSPAFYMVPAIDSTGSQIIYINSSHLPDDLDLYTTLAHEGYPGHLYQNVYFASTDPSPLRWILGCGGYTEGWATYTEMMSYYFTDLTTEQAALLQRNASVLLGLYALADIGIHYEGWTLLDTVSFFREYGISDADVVEEIYDLIIADPANYLKYYIGYVEFLELKKEAINQWGEDFTQKRFHQAVLDAGAMPFYLLEDAVLGR